jgi:hypothetical protein
MYQFNSDDSSFHSDLHLLFNNTVQQQWLSICCCWTPDCFLSRTISVICFRDRTVQLYNSSYGLIFSHQTLSALSDNLQCCAVFSLEPLAQDPRRRDYGHALCKSVYPYSSPLFSHNQGLIIFLWLSLCCSSEQFTLLQTVLGLVAKFCFGVYSGEVKGCVLAPCVTFVCCWSIHKWLTLSLLTSYIYHVPHR